VGRPVLRFVLGWISKRKSVDLFRDMLLGLFFVTVGMQVDPRAMASAPLQATLWHALFVLAKPVMALLAMRIARYDNRAIAVRILRLRAPRLATAPR
jgi:Kef-type K+ transport system membrane component KefB